MFVRALLAQYGKGVIRTLPDYLPSGITLENNAL
jgi:hypothetical protein